MLYYEIKFQCVLRGREEEYSKVGSGKESACNAGNLGLILESGKSPGEQHGYPLQYSYPENSMCRRAWRAKVH